jgi:hypothetical protein
MDDGLEQASHYSLWNLRGYELHCEYETFTGAVEEEDTHRVIHLLIGIKEPDYLANITHCGVTCPLRGLVTRSTQTLAKVYPQCAMPYVGNRKQEECSVSMFEFPTTYDHSSCAL